ncbi:MAG: S1C family serine protease [Acidimicrobiales bacterium]
MAATIVVSLLGGGVAGAVAARTIDPPTARTTVLGNAARSTPASNSLLTTKPIDLKGILAKVEPGVVYVRTQDFRGGPFFPVQGAGTGMILTPDGEVLTNAHVVRGATSIEVTLAGQTQAHPAQLIGADSADDLALLRIQGVSGLPVVSLGQSSALSVGDDVVAIGNALNLKGGFTVTKGIVSALDRSLDGQNALSGGFIQTDAAINPGNSGGPLVNSSGQVVGINTAVAASGGQQAAQNIGFAIAIDRAKPVIDALKRGTGSANATNGTGFLGIGTSTYRPQSRGGPQVGTDQGALVMDVVPGSPAESAGIQVDDVIVSFAGTTISSSGDLITAVRDHKAGDQVTVVWYRGPNRQSAKLKLASRPAGA